MARLPIFVATHPRSCSTAFERVFMTRKDSLVCAHEPFGDAFYFGPERLSTRFADQPERRDESGFSNVTYKNVLDSLLEPDSDKRVFIKDMAYYLFAPDGKPNRVAPSLASLASNVDAGCQTGPSAVASPNPTVLPRAVLKRFCFAFLIRHPRHSIPSHYRCTLPPLADATRFETFSPSEAGYSELRRLFEYLIDENIGSGISPAGRRLPIAVLDADDLLDRPAAAIAAFCRAVGLPYSPDMLRWDDADNQQHAAAAFAKWNGWHNDALASTGLHARPVHKTAAYAIPPTREEEDAAWRVQYGEAGQKVIRACVDANTPDYEYMKQFALTF